MADTITWDTKTGDLPAGTFGVSTGKEAVRQRLVQRIKTWRGEWFLATDLGVPYFTEVFVRPPVLAPIVVAREARLVQDVASIASTEFSEQDDPDTPSTDDRRYRVAFDATTTDGENVPVDETV